MSKKKTINFKDSSHIHLWLRFALKKEKEKYEKCPVEPDLMPDYEATQWWGYIVTGYFLMEQAFKGFCTSAGKKSTRNTRYILTLNHSKKRIKRSLENTITTIETA